MRSQYANQEIRKLEKERYNSYDNNTAEIISKIIALSKSGRVLCSHTAFVGVSNRMSVGEPTVHQSILDIHYTESNCPPPRIPSVGRGNRRPDSKFDRFYLRRLSFGQSPKNLLS